MEASERGDQGAQGTEPSEVSKYSSKIKSLLEVMHFYVSYKEILNKMTVLCNIRKLKYQTTPNL